MCIISDFGGFMKFACYTLGCKVNQYETQAMEQLLMQSGHTLGSFDEICDGYIINTCTVTAVSDKKSRNAIRRVRKLNPNAVVGVCGCYAQSSPDEIRKLDVDVLIGTDGREAFVRHMIGAAQTRQKWDCVDDAGGPRAFEILPAGGLAARTRALLKVEDGCNNFCTYCIVPYVRGRERSRDMKSIISECEKLINDGYKEITLLGQNVNSYGNDVPDANVNFANLLREVAKIDGKFRIRFMTSHPKDLTEDVVKAIRDNDKICNNIHLPIQAGSNSVLKNMNRRYTREHYLGLIDMIRRYLPDCGITTDIMVGFPYETEEDFLDTMDIVEKVRFSTAFTFIYSVRKGTKAAEMPQIPYEIKQNRIKRLIARQNEITEEISKDYVGNVYEILVEGMQEKKNGYVVGRTESGRLVSAKGDESMIGEFKNVKITAVKNAQLLGEIL